MGNFSSKSSLEVEALDPLSDSGSSSPSPSDPRSPSLSIDRTPIQQATICTNSKVTKNVDLTKECFHKFDDVPINPTLRAVMNEFDPRSPTLDFERTPLSFLLKDTEWVAAHNHMDSSAILDSSVTSHQEKELQPKNLCHDLANLSMQSEKEQHVIEPTVKVPDEVTPRDNIVSVNEQSPKELNTGLLETNFDYLETDIDTVRRQRYKEFNEKLRHISAEVKTEVIERKIQGNIIVEEVVQEVVSEDITYKDLSDKDPRSPSGGIDRTPILIAEKDSVNVNVKKTRTNKKINSRVKEVMMNNAKLHNNMKHKDNDIKTIAKDSLLIYEDNIENVTPTVHASKSALTVQQNSEKSRTPLACMMNIDKPLIGSLHNTPVEGVTKSSHGKSKIPVRVSKISPDQVFEKTVKSRRLITRDIENTPPQPRKACWDKDGSVVL